MEEKRFGELYRRSCEKGCTVYSDFLNLERQSILCNMRIPFEKFGGFKNAERVVAAFGDDISEEDFPVSLLEIRPVNSRFADKLTHRDFLGAVMNLGIKRELLGDIVISDNTGYLFCLVKIKDYITDNLKKVRHTAVSVTEAEALPENISTGGTVKEIIVPALRTDAVISACFKLSRSESLLLFKNEKVFINSRKIVSPSQKLADNDIISVRGFGRIIFNGVIKSTKKDKPVILVEIFR